MSFDAGDIRAEATLDKRPFIRSLRELRAEGAKFAAQTFTPKVGADTAPGDAKVLAFQRKLISVGTSTTTAKVSADTTEALLKIQPLTVKLDDIRNRVATARVDANTDAARRKLDTLDLQLRRVGLITSRPRVSLAGAESANIQLDSIAAKLAALSAASAAPGVPGSSGGGGGGSLLSRVGSHAPGFGALALGAALPIAAPLAGVAAGAAASFLTPTLAGGIGGGLFAKVASSQYKVLQTDVKTLTTLQQRYNAATTNKARTAALAAEKKAWDALSPAEQKAVTTQHQLTSEWDAFRKKLQPQTFKLFATGADIADKGLRLLLPTTRASGNAINSLSTQADHALNQPFWKDFFGNFLPGEAHRSLMTLGTDLGHGVDGLAHLMKRLAPLGHDLEHLSTGWASSFDKWTQGQGPAKFVAWVEKEGPVVGSALTAIGHGLDGVGKGIAPLGQVELKALTPVLNAIGDLGDAHPRVITAVGAALLTVGVGLKAIEAAKGAAAVIGAIRGLRGGDKGITGGGIGGPGPCCCGPGEGGGGGTPVGGPVGGKAPREPSPIGAGKTFLGGTLAGSFPDSPTGRPLLGGASDAVKLAKQLYAAGATSARAVAIATAGYPSQTKALGDWRAEVDKATKAQRDGLNKAMTEGQTAAGGVAAKIDAYRQKLVDQGEPLQAVITKTAIYAAKLKGLPAGVHTKVIADTSQADRSLDIIRKKITTLPDHTVTITTTTRGGTRHVTALTPARLNAVGGFITGPGTGTSDSIPAMLSNGEFVINAKATARHRQLLHAINAGRYAGGGQVHLPSWYKSGNHPSPNSGSGSSGSSSGGGSSSGSGSSGGSSPNKGPSHLTISNALASITSFAGLTFASDLQGTAHQVRSGITQMIDRLNSAVRNHYVAGDKKLVKALRAARAPLAKLADEEATITKSLASAQQRLSTLRGNAASVRSGTVGSFLGLGDLTQASNTTTVGGLLSVEGQQVKVARAFHRNLAHLRKLGLSRDEYKALEQVGPAAAGQIVGLLATSNRRQIGHFNRDEATLRQLGVSTGSASADYLYKSKIGDAQKEVASFRADRREIIRHEKRTADAVETLVKSGLQDHGTHAALADVKAAIHRSNQLLEQLTGAPKQAHANHRAHVAGVNR